MKPKYVSVHCVICWQSFDILEEYWSKEYVCIECLYKSMIALKNAQKYIKKYIGDKPC